MHAYGNESKAFLPKNIHLNLRPPSTFDPIQEHILHRAQILVETRAYGTKI